MLSEVDTSFADHPSYIYPSFTSSLTIDFPGRLEIFNSFVDNLLTNPFSRLSALAFEVVFTRLKLSFHKKLKQLIKIGISYYLISKIK
jgi:hypothetical protein